MIHYFSEDCNYQLRHKKKVTSWIKSIILSKGYQVGSINYIFTSDRELLEMNKQYLSHDYRTDILTFDTSDYEETINIDSENDSTEQKNLVISGDLFISIDTVRFNAKYYEQKMNYELYRVIIHGILHLMGYNDLSPEEKVEMTRQENLALAKIEIDA